MAWVNSNPTRSARIGHLHGCRCFSNYARSWVGSTRSLNLHTAALERRLYLFRANKLRSLAFGTPHWGDASFVCPLRQRMPVPMDRHFDYVSHITRRPRTVPCILQGNEQGRKRFSFPSSLNISDHFQPFVHNAQIFLSPFRLRPFSRVSQSIPDFSRDYVNMKMRE